MLLTETTPVNYSEEKLKIKLAVLQAKLDLKEDSEDFEIKELVYKKGDTKSVYVSMHHKKCGNDFHVTTSRFFNNVNAKCPCCGTRINRDVIEKELDKEGYDLVTKEDLDSRSTMVVKHRKCNSIYPITVRSFREGHRCVKCRKIEEAAKKRAEDEANGIVTKIEVDLTKKLSRTDEALKQEFVDFMNEIAEGTTLVRDEDVKSTGMKPNYYIDSKNLAVNYVELITHSLEGSLGTYDRRYFKDMLDILDANGVRLINVTDQEWREKKELVKSKIRHIAKMNKTEVVHARKCEVKELDASKRNKFLTKHHIQGVDRANVSLGLYTKGENPELVAVMSFVKPRKAMNGNTDLYDYELSRYAATTEKHVVGGFGKLFKHFKNNYEWSKIITYADLRWTSPSNSVYLTNGFTYTHSSTPSYSYVNLSSPVPEREYRFSYRKSELEHKFPQYWNGGKSTEHEIMKAAGYGRVYDCGNLVFTYDR